MQEFALARLNGDGGENVKFNSFEKNLVINRSEVLPTEYQMTEAERHKQFESWVHEHGAVLQHVANGFAEGHDRHDLMQEILLALWKALPAFRGDSKPSTFIYRVAHNKALTWRRSLMGHRRKLRNLAMMAEPAGPGNSDISNIHRLERVYAAIRQLPPLDCSLMLLSLDGVNYRDMAVIHGISETNVGVRLNRARQRLTSALKGIDDEH